MFKSILHHFLRKLTCLTGPFLLALITFLTISSLSAKDPIVKFAESIEKGDIETVQKMLADGLAPNTRIPKSRLNYTPLFLSVKSTHPSITKALLKAGADPTMEDENGDPVMVYAADPGREKHARLLIQHGTSIDSTNSEGITALLRGAPYEKGPDIQVKIDLGANLNLTDPKGKTALMRAAGAGNLEAMKVLIKAGAKLNISNKAGESALTLALGLDSYNDDRTKNTAAVKLLIEASANINQRHANEQSVLILALDSWGAPQETIETLLAAKPDISVRDKDGRDALYHAVLSKKRNIHIARLLELGADPNTTDNEGITLLMRAARNFQPDLVRDLISQGLLATDKSQAGETAVHFASAAGRYGAGDLSSKAKGKKIVCVLKLLHKHGASLTAPDKVGDTPLHLAAIPGIPKVISHLLPHYPDVEIQNTKGETPLHLAAVHGSTEAVKLLIPGCKKIDQLDSLGHTALMNAIKGDHRRTFLELLGAGANIHAKNHDGISALSAALVANQIDKIKFLLENGADPKSLKDPDSELLRVARLFHDQITSPEDYAFLIDLFSKLVTDIDHRDAEGMTALMWVATSRNEAALKAILDRGAKLDVRSKDGRTALMWAACSRAIDSMKILVAAGANESLRDPTGRTATEWFAWTNASHKATTHPQSKGLIPLGERIVRSRQIALQTYLKQGTWQKDDRVAEIPPLHLAAALGETGAITTLLKLGAPENLTMTDGSTPLMEAAANGRLKAVELLLDKGADPALRDSDRKRAIDYAIALGHVDVARLFLQRKMAFSNNESDLLSALVYRGDEALLREFLQSGVVILPRTPKEKNESDPFGGNGRTSNSASALIAAATRADSKMLKILMEFPKASGAAEPDIRTSAFHHAAYRGRLTNIKIFVEELKIDLDILLSDSFGGVTVSSSSDSADKRPQPIKKFSALSRALEEGFPNVVRYLVQQGATISGRTRGGAPPLTFVIEHRQDEMLRFFLKNNAPMELVDFEGLTALHRAAASNHELAVRLLLNHGADPKAKTPKGLTPLDLAHKNKAKESITLLKLASK